jgi:hypothetical protein
MIGLAARAPPRLWSRRLTTGAGLAQLVERLICNQYFACFICAPKKTIHIKKSKVYMNYDFAFIVIPTP